MNLVIPNTSEVAKGIWFATVEPENLERLGHPKLRMGPVSIVAVPASEFVVAGKSLSFGMSNIAVLNLGTTSKTIVIANTLENRELMDEPLMSGDIEFWQQLNEMPKSVQALGEKLLKEIRKTLPGKLVFFPKSKKFVEKPNNYWAVRLQPRDESLRITVRGNVRQFKELTALKISPDQNSYSAFKVEQLQQVPDAVKAILKAAGK